MKPEEFSHYVNTQLRQGISRDALIANLHAGGWTDQQIDTAFREHDKVVRTELAPTHRRTYSIAEMFLWLALVLVVLMTYLFYLGGE